MPHDPNQIIAPDEILAGEDYPASMDTSGIGTVFPSIRGGSPGDQDPGQNLGDYPFGAPLHGEDSLPISGVAQSGIVSPAEVQAAEEPLPDSGAMVLEGAAAAIPPGGQSVSGRKRSAEERIHQLTAKWRSSQTENTVLNQQVAQLSQLIQNMQAQQNSPSPAPRPYGSGEASPSDNPFASAGQPSAPVQHATDLRRIVQESVAPLANQVTGLLEAQRQRALQEASFARAVADFPDIGKPGTEANAHFRDLMQNHALGTLDDGPEQVAVFVRGILAGARRDSQIASQRKVQAGVQVPTPSPSDEIAIGPSRGQQIVDLHKQAAQNYRTGDRSFETYKALRLAGRARTQLRNR